ncbi:MAG: SUF system NifU family Fe-S cluster assembly protein [Candidatus Saccharibacteria bacterium]|nr:SUF system NifU family Fe-S cluster assembly protein [Candidatus Saccharibacteria bacterium]
MMPKDKDSDCRRAGFQSETASACSVPTSKFYRQFILEASRSPKYRGKIEETGLRPGEKVVRLEGSNPSCGDQLTLYLKIADNRIVDAKFEGSGCAISMASAHFLCENLIGKNLKSAREYVEKYLRSLDSGAVDPDYTPFDNFALMLSRVKCARLGWGTAGEMLKR